MKYFLSFKGRKERIMFTSFARFLLFTLLILQAGVGAFILYKLATLSRDVLYSHQLMKYLLYWASLGSLAFATSVGGTIEFTVARNMRGNFVLPALLVAVAFYVSERFSTTKPRLSWLIAGLACIALPITALIASTM